MGVFFFLPFLGGWTFRQDSQRHFAIVPHFMLDSDKVDQFYNLIKYDYYPHESDLNGLKIILISPNHFDTKSHIEQTICTSNNVKYNNNALFLSSYLTTLGINCDNKGNIFNKRGSIITTNEHGIGEHFQWLNKYFPDSTVFPIILPTHNIQLTNDIYQKLSTLSGNILVIASVDFAHYLPESITLENDKQSIAILESTELNESDFINNINADCPACLYLLQSLAHNNSQRGKVWYRDSSSTILHQDMGKDNTSRIFIQYFQELPKAKKIKHNNIDFFNPTYLVAGGDVMLSRDIGYYNKQLGYDRIFKEGNYTPLNNFTDCKSGNCLLFLNLESLFYEPDNDTLERSFTFRSNPKNIETLLQYKEDKPLLLTLTNNHFINGGFQGFTTTKQILSDNNIPYIGAGFTQEESRQIFTRENNGIDFCFGSYSYDGRSTKVLGGNVTRNEIDENKIKSDIQKMRDMKCDIKIISLHRGNEYKYSPNTQQKKLAHSLIDSGADLILGGHSHIPGEFELYNGKYIFYSLGNFLFDQDRGKIAKGKEFDYFYDADLQRKNVPTYISMLIGLKFTKNFKKDITITLDNIDFSSTTSGIFTDISEETSNNLLAIIDKTK